MSWNLEWRRCQNAEFSLVRTLGSVGFGGEPDGLVASDVLDRVPRFL